MSYNKGESLRMCLLSKLTIDSGGIHPDLPSLARPLKEFPLCPWSHLCGRSGYEGNLKNVVATFSRIAILRSVSHFNFLLIIPVSYFNPMEVLRNK